MTISACWMCGAPATTAEHRLKRADLARAYGKGPFFGDDCLIHIRGDKTTRLSSTKSKAVKYAKILCEYCNTTGSQPYDLAYDALINWLVVHEKDVLRNRFINFVDVYGSANFEVDQRNLYKYFAKSFGCRISEAGHAVPIDVTSLLNQQSFETGLRLSFSVHQGRAAEPAFAGLRCVGNGALYTWLDPSDQNGSKGYTCDQFVSWFTTHFWYCMKPDGDMGATWVADSQHLYLGIS